jgi:hypothetical protein
MDRWEREGLREPLTDDMISSVFDQRFTANAAADWNVRSFELRGEGANLQVTRGRTRVRMWVFPIVSVEDLFQTLETRSRAGMLR